MEEDSSSKDERSDQKRVQRRRRAAAGGGGGGDEGRCIKDASVSGGGEAFSFRDPTLLRSSSSG